MRGFLEPLSIITNTQIGGDVRITGRSGGALEIAMPEGELCIGRVFDPSPLLVVCLSIPIAKWRAPILALIT